MGSARLPGKVLRPILGRPMLWHIVHRLRQVPGIATIVVATSDQPSDLPLRDFCRECGIPVFPGSENDVLDRFYRAAVAYEGDPVLRITGDCPCVDPQLVERLLDLYEQESRFDHVGIATGAGAIYLDGTRFPNGLDVECFSFTALERAWREARLPADREHVTPYIWRNKQWFRCGYLKSEQDYSHLRWTVDCETDFQLVSRIYEALYREDRPFLVADILEYLSRHPELAAANQSLIGAEGYQELWTPGKHSNS